MTTDPNFDALRQLRAANPHPVTPLTKDQRARADETLAAILGEATPEESRTEARDDLAARRETKNPRRFWGTGFAAAAAATLVVAAGGLVYVGSSPTTATAEEVLGVAAEASSGVEKAQDVGVSAVDYLARTDADAGGSVTTVYSGGEKSRTVEGAPGEVVRDWKPRLTPDELRGADVRTLVGDSPARGALELLVTPGISAAQQRDLYALLASLDGNDVTAVSGEGDDEKVTIAHASEGLEFDLMPATGQLVRVVGLLGPDVVTTVSSMAVLDCVSVVGLQGPDQVSLACADNNQLLTELQWSNWGADTATARGVEWLNNCDPFCADGKFTRTPVTVRAYAPTSCGFNTRVYSKLEVAYPDGRAETHNIGCVE